ncbi:PepSY domain-containing protein [Parahaliea mediterranea]|uniref:PepSY domain-containing protein n=1 Tax=Parahaliea mediterranea TaxID=651086 RepID=UPI000E2FBA94|nr:PepSY domain-containing protein [Parahaliea mediterranea]
MQKFPVLFALVFALVAGLALWWLLARNTATGQQQPAPVPTRAPVNISIEADSGDDWLHLNAAVSEGRLVGLPQLLDWLEARYVGQVLEVELESEDGITVYEIEMVGAQGQVVEFEFDAVSGELLQIDGPGVEAMVRQ